MRNFLFYDLETSGLSKSFDQILQFAAVRCDAKLREIERYSFYVKLRPDIIPSPLASITHRISIEKTRKGLTEYDAVCKIHKLINTPGTISIGYNTMGFDDEFLRFSFYRNLLTPYTHQFANECVRMDLFPMAVMYSLYKRDVIKWPVIEEKTSLKLENLNKANDLAHGQAHDATVDVDITIELARKFMQEKEMWKYLTRYFDKNEDLERTNQMPEVFQSESGIHRLAIMSSGSFGNKNNFHAPVLLIGNSIPYKNQWIWLRLDFPELRNATKDNISEHCYTIRKKLGEPEFLLPPKERFLEKIVPERKKEMDKNIKWLQNNPEIFKEISSHFRTYKYDNIPDLDIDTSLYQNGFMDDDERVICETFHKLRSEDKYKAVRSFKTNDNRELGHRIMHRNFKSLVPEDSHYNFEPYLAKINPKEGDKPLMDFKKHERMTPKAALKEIDSIKQDGLLNLDSQQKYILAELENYIKDNFVPS
ncbi:MAG: exodeoxyribonuclease I [Deltaproteobacteria bacterium]|nr:exodeoxyribonuclease I [Deltaproteobacteria bacterium]